MAELTADREEAPLRMNRFRNAVAIVTGGASGIGAATVIEFVKEGAKVVLVDLNRRAGEAYERELTAANFEARYVEGDIGSAQDCQRAVEETLAAFGQVDALVNSAASFIAQGIRTSAEDWKQSLGVNVVGTVNMTQAASAPMKRRARGVIINVASVSAYVAQSGNWTYNAGKAALISLTRSMAMDFAEWGIRVNSVSPGWIWTPPAAAAVGGDRSKLEQTAGPFHLLGRCGEPREVARAILFLCSDDASFITGTDLRVDGGYLAMGPEGAHVLPPAPQAGR